MLTVWNRREVKTFPSLSRCEEAAKLLENHGIETMIRVWDRASPSAFQMGSRERSGTLLHKRDTEIHYVLYVHRRAYDDARSLLGFAQW